MRLLERVILKCEGSVVLKAIESTECVGDSEKARLGNTTFLELTFPNSGCRGAATLWLFRSETRVNFAFSVCVILDTASMTKHCAPRFIFIILSASQLRTDVHFGSFCHNIEFA